MGLQDFISETEASSYSGVSIATLNRFVEAGYLQIEADSDGLRLFSKSQLTSLFGLQSFQDFTNPQLSESPQTQPTAEIMSFHNQEDPITEGKAVTQSEHEPPSLDDEPFTSSPGAEKPTEPVVGMNALKILEIENTKLRHLNQLHEKLLTLREAEIKDLKEQRDWLRIRLERMEEKGERDQILLLSEAQTLRKLISLQEERRSPIRAALDWLGFTQPIQRIADSSISGKSAGSTSASDTRNTSSRTATNARNMNRSSAGMPDRSGTIEVPPHNVSSNDVSSDDSPDAVDSSSRAA